MPSTTPVDGRTRRAQRTRDGVVDAVLALIADGDLRPTAPRIAERAGVSLRSVFQHFNDLDALFAAAADRELSNVAADMEFIDPGAPRADRVAAFVAQRAMVLERFTPSRRASLLQEAQSATLVAIRDRLLALAREEVEGTFRSELDARRGRDRADLLDALDAVTSWQTWEALRAHQQLAVRDAIRVVERTVNALLAG